MVILKSILYRIKYPGVLGQNNYNQVRLTHCWWEGYNFGLTLLDISLIKQMTMMTMMRRITYPTLAGFQHHWAAGQPDWLSAEKEESLCPLQCQSVVARWSKIAQPGPVWCPTEGQKAGEEEEEEETWDTSTSKFCHTSHSKHYQYHHHQT